MAMANMLLVNGSADHPWIELLRRVVFNLGKSLTVIDQQRWKEVPLQDYELIVLDASAVANPTSMIHEIRSWDPRARILVVTPAPHWKQARETLLAGAIDYVRKIEDKAMIESFLRRLPLQRHPNTI